MPMVTVLGAGGSTVSIEIDSARNAQVAQTLLGILSGQIQDGTVTPFTYDGLGPLNPPSGLNELIVTGPGEASAPVTTRDVIDVAGGPLVLLGGNAPEQLVVADSPLVYFANSGAGTVIASGGGTEIIEQHGGDHLFLTDGGNNHILALSGNDTIGAGPGDNTIVLGSGNDLVQVTGHDKIVAGSGQDTIQVLSGDAMVRGGTGSLTFINGSGASTVFGGDGSATLSGGAGGGVYKGGTDGNNLLVTGLQATTLFGAGNHDQLYAIGGGNDLLVAGRGSETLTGAGTGSDTFIGGSGRDVISGGFGYNTFVAGHGNETLTGGLSGNTYVFSDESEGHFVITYFTAGSDTILLQGFRPGEVKEALEHQHHHDGGTMIKLGDDTTITFQNVSHVKASWFG